MSKFLNLPETLENLYKSYPFLKKPTKNYLILQIKTYLFLKKLTKNPLLPKLYLGQTKLYIKIKIQQFIWHKKIQA